MKKVQYKIDINNGCRKGKEYVYTFGTTKDIRLIIGKQKATIVFSMTVKKSMDDMISFRVKAFRDAYRKVYLLHAIQNSTGLNVKTIKISIDAEDKIFDKTYPDFPFLFSMITNNNLELSSAWSDACISNYIVDTTKSSSDTDYKYCAINAYFMSKGRQYEIDRFLNLWTAVNSVMNSYALTWEDGISEKTGVSRSELKSKYKVLRRDELCLCLLIYLLTDGKTILKKKYGDSSEFNRAIQDLESIIRKTGRKNYTVLKEQLIKGIVSDGNSYETLITFCDENNMSLYYFALLLLPYKLRCDYFHGSKAYTLVSAYNDKDLVVLQYVNYLLDSWLNTEIPKMFMLESFDAVKTAQIQECFDMREKKK